MKYVLENLGKEVKLISNDPLSEALNETEFSKEVEFGKDILSVALEDFDILISLDTGGTEMIGKFKKEYVLPNNLFVVNIDHHPDNKLYGNMNYIDTKQPSTCSILIELFKAAEIDFDASLSTRLLLGLCTDSGFFTFTPGAEKALKQANFLIENGGEYLAKIVVQILHKQPLNLKKYYSLLTMKLKFNKKKNFAYAIVTEEEIKRLKLNKADVRLGINDLQYIKEFDFVFTLAELGNEIKGSFRSQKGIDISMFARELGGGGHKQAAAFVLPKMPLEEAEKRVLNAIEKVGIHKTN
jgi:phosphoesterase RecJ-like protein